MNLQYSDIALTVHALHISFSWDIGCLEGTSREIGHEKVRFDWECRDSPGHPASRYDRPAGAG
jgi:hypothetical protein